MRLAAQKSDVLRNIVHFLLGCFLFPFCVMYLHICVVLEFVLQSVSSNWQSSSRVDDGRSTAKITLTLGKAMFAGESSSQKAKAERSS